MVEIHLERISAEKKVQLIKLGRMYGSPTVKAQGEQVLGALERHGDVMSRYGFIKADADELRACVGMYEGQLEERQEKKIGRSLNSSTLKEQVKAAGPARLRGRTVLEATRNRLESSANEGSSAPTEAVLLIRSALDQTSAGSREADVLLAQLRRLAFCWTIPVIAATASARGGDEVKSLINAHIAALEGSIKDLHQAEPSSAVTQRLDLIDGLIIERVREARRVAKAAAKAEGDPALADAFKLTHLYG